MSRWSQKFRSKEELAIEGELDIIAGLKKKQTAMEKEILAGAPKRDHSGVVQLKRDLADNLNEQGKAHRRIERIKEKQDKARLK